MIRDAKPSDFYHGLNLDLPQKFRKAYARAQGVRADTTVMDLVAVSRKMAALHLVQLMGLAKAGRPWKHILPLLYQDFQEVGKALDTLPAHYSRSHTKLAEHASIHIAMMQAAQKADISPALIDEAFSSLRRADDLMLTHTTLLPSEEQ